MKKKVKDTLALRNELYTRYPILLSTSDAIDKAYSIILKTYSSGGKLLVAGNGGSAADSEHIVGELMKSFLFHRRIDTTVESNLRTMFGEKGKEIAEKLEGALPTISLTTMPALNTAFANDVDASVVFAQMLYGYGAENDAFLGISTSGNSSNIIQALMVAKAKGIKTIGLSGSTGGVMKQLCDVCICVPEDETFKIQELHLPIYHCLCSMLEAQIFEERINRVI